MAPSTPPASLHNLPIALTSFVGREYEIAEVQRLLATTRLLTLAGPGGCGKTRLATERATTVISSYPDGVWLIELAALADLTLATQTVAAALGVREAPDKPLIETLAAFLKPKQLLLLLDMGAQRSLPAFPYPSVTLGALYSESRYGWSRCLLPRLGARPGDSAGSNSARTDTSHL